MKQPAGDAQTLVEGRVAPGTSDVSTDSRGAMDGNSQDSEMDVYLGGDIDESLQRERIRKRMFGEARPVMLGGLEVRERLGEGGTADVFAAYDPQLKRTVAIKMLRPVEGGAALNVRERLLREAQAMADIDHANVVKVHNVEIKNEPPYVVMEYFPEGSLRRWQRHEHGLREVLDVYMQAGAGLAELHRAKLVHRDFKPDNIFRKQDGRVAVGDLGLVSMEPADSSESGSVEASGDEAGKLTEAGVILGTVAYMAPEQLRGEPADARSDQFCFCLALYEAACGTHPYMVRGREQRLRAIERRELAAPARKVPGWLLGVLQRGLAPEPGERFASMDVLLGALERGRTRRRRMATAAVMLAGVAIVAAAAVVLVQPSSDDPCDPGRIAAEAFGDIWDGERQRVVKERLETAGAGGLWPLVKQAFERSIDGWAMVRCNTREGMYEKRDIPVILECLEDNKRTIEAKSSGLSEIEPLQQSEIEKITSRVVYVVDRLERLKACSNIDNLRNVGAPPPGKAMEIGAVKNLLRDAESLEDSGKYVQALALAERASSLADITDYKPIRSLAQFRLGHIWGSQGKGEDAIRHLKLAAMIAAQGDDKILVAETLVYLVKVIAVDIEDVEEEETWLKAAELSMNFAGQIPDDGGHIEHMSLLYADYLEAQGLHAYNRDKLKEAIEAHNAALRIREKSRSPRAKLDIPKSLNNLANAHAEAREWTESLEYYDQAYRIRKDILGERHPLVSEVSFNIGDTYYQLKRYTDARMTLERVEAIDRSTYGPSLKLVPVLALLGDIALEEKRSSDADAVAGKILEIISALSDTDARHIDAASGYMFLAKSNTEPRDAMQWAEKAKLILEESGDDESAMYGEVLIQLGKLHRKLNNKRLACDIGERGLALLADEPSSDDQKIRQDLCGE